MVEVLPGAWFPKVDESAQRPAAFVQPSSLEESGVVVASETLGDPIPLAGRPEMTHVGNAIHGFFAADHSGTADSKRHELAARLLKAWDLEASVMPADVIKASDALRAWIEATWPGALWHHEWPVSRLLESGSTLRGQADLVLELKEQFVVIDHKSFHGGLEASKARVAGFAGQLAAYAEAIALATRKLSLGTYIHLPVLGQIMEVKAADPE